jgi:hypothetical protein
MVPCEQKEHIAKIEAKTEHLVYLVDGKERPGIHQIVMELTSGQNILIQSVKDLTTSVSALVRFQIEMETTTKYMVARKINNRWIIGTLIAFVGILIALLEYRR